MRNKNYIYIGLLTTVCLSLVGSFMIMGYEKEQNKYNMEISTENKLEDKYFENAGKLGKTENQGILNSVSRNIKKISDQDRVNKLASGIMAEYYYLINTKQLEKAYSLLNKEYVEEFGMNKNIFDARNHGTFVNGYTITNIESNFSDEIILINYLVRNEEGFISRDMAIIEDNGEYTIALNGLSESTKISKDTEVNGINISVSRRYKIGSSVAYKVIVENNSKEVLEIKNTPYGFYGVIQGNKYNHTIENATFTHRAEDYVITDGNTKAYILKFNTSNYLEKVCLELKNGDLIEIDL